MMDIKVSSVNLNLIMMALVLTGFLSPFAKAQEDAAAPDSHETCPVPVLPDQFTIKRRMISIPITFLIKDNEGKVFGKIKQRMFKFRYYKYLDDDGNLLAVGRKVPFSIPSKMEIFDCKGVKIGEIRQEIFKSLSMVKTSYLVFDVAHQVVAESRKIQLVGTSIILYDFADQPIVELKRPMVNPSGEKWKVNIIKHGLVDTRTLVMIAAFWSSTR